jgi:hypothetical protein
MSRRGTPSGLPNDVFRPIDISELAKAEGGVTCLSLWIPT